MASPLVTVAKAVAKKLAKDSAKKANARGLKAASKPTKASKTFVGSNKNLSPSVRRDIIVNQTKPARPNRERGGSLKTLRKQGKTSSTTKIPDKPKSGLENRGAKPNALERVNRARDIQWDKAEKNYDAANEMRYTGLVSSNKGLVAARGAGKKNARKSAAIRKEAGKKLPIKINSQSNLKKKAK